MESPKKYVFNRTLRHDLSNLTLEEARGYVVDRLILLEGFLNESILFHFKPAEELHAFREVLLNSSVIGFAAKAKVLHGVKKINFKLFNKILRLSSIRNGFAHAAITTHRTIQISPGKIQLQDIHQKITVMSSNGDVKDHRAGELFDEFVILFHEVEEEFRPLLAPIRQLETENRFREELKFAEKQNKNPRQE